MADLNRNVMLRTYTYRSLYEDLQKSDAEFVTFLQDLGLLHSKRTCRKCGWECTIYNEGTGYRCGNWKCRKTVSMRVGTMFEGSHLTLKQIYELSYYWCRGNALYPEVNFQTRSWAEKELSEQTWVDWKQYFRDVCSEFFVENPVQIGGADVVVEIDETFLARRKYNRGHIRGNHGQWIFGGVVRGDASKCFLVPVEQRNAATLLPIIQKFVLPHTTIISDLWKAESRREQSQIVRACLR